MSKSVNRVTLLGGVGNDPEFKTIPNGTPFVSLSLATNKSYKDKDDNWQEAVEWHNLVAYGRTAENIRDHVVKGSKVYIDGSLQTRSWEDKETGKKVYRTEIVVNEVVFMSQGSKKDYDSEPAF